MRKGNKRLLSLALSLVMALSLCVCASAEEGGPSADLLDAAGTSVTESLLMDNSVYTLQHWAQSDDQSTETRIITAEDLEEPESHDFTYLYALPLGVTLKMDLPESQYVYVYAYSDNGKSVYPQRLAKVTKVGETVSAELQPAGVSGPLASFEDLITGDMEYYAGAFLLNGSDNVRLSGYDSDGECELEGTVFLTGDYLTNLFGANSIVEVELNWDLTICLYLTGETLASAPAPAAPADTAAPAATSTGFSDVADTSAFAPGVKWAVENNVTTGYADGTFKPSNTCSQANILTFLWRAAGEPEPAGAVEMEGFDGTEYYYKASQWAAEQGLVEGEFDPDGPCTRSMVVTYLWKLAGNPAPSASAAFPDVAADAAYAQAVAWAVENGITTGKTDGSFGPEDTCTRGQIVTFLYRDFGK